MERKTKSLKIDPLLWKEVKIHCASIERDISEYIEKLIIEDKKKWKR